MLTRLCTAHTAFTKTIPYQLKGINASVPFGFRTRCSKFWPSKNPHTLVLHWYSCKKRFATRFIKSIKPTARKTRKTSATVSQKVKEIIRGFNIPVLEMDGYEADDIIGTLAKEAEKLSFWSFHDDARQGFRTAGNGAYSFVQTGLHGQCGWYYGAERGLRNGTSENVSQVIDILGLQGDSSDNIPGIPGIGPKRQPSWLKIWYRWKHCKPMPIS